MTSLSRCCWKSIWATSEYSEYGSLDPSWQCMVIQSYTVLTVPYFNKKLGSLLSSCLKEVFPLGGECNPHLYHVPLLHSGWVKEQRVVLATAGVRSEEEKLSPTPYQQKQCNFWGLTSECTGKGTWGSQVWAAWQFLLYSLCTNSSYSLIFEV